MNISNLSDLINIKNYVSSVLNNRNLIVKEDYRVIQSKLDILDKKIISIFKDLDIDQLSLNIKTPILNIIKPRTVFESTEFDKVEIPKVEIPKTVKKKSKTKESIDDIDDDFINKRILEEKLKRADKMKKKDKVDEIKPE